MGKKRTRPLRQRRKPPRAHIDNELGDILIRANAKLHDGKDVEWTTVDAYRLHHWLTRVCISDILLTEHLGYVRGLSKPTSAEELEREYVTEILRGGFSYFDKPKILKLAFNEPALIQLHSVLKHARSTYWLYVIACELTIPRMERDRRVRST